MARFCNSCKSSGLHRLIANMHIHAIDIHVPQVFVGLASLKIILLAALQMLESLVGKYCVSLPAGSLQDAILEEPVNEIDVRTQ